MGRNRFISHIFNVKHEKYKVINTKKTVKNKKKSELESSSSEEDEEINLETDEDGNEDFNENLYVGYGENYRHAKEAVDSIQCINCMFWLHEACTFYSDFCQCGKLNLQIAAINLPAFSCSLHTVPTSGSSFRALQPNFTLPTTITSQASHFIASLSVVSSTTFILAGPVTGASVGPASRSTNRAQRCEGKEEDMSLRSIIYARETTGTRTRNTEENQREERKYNIRLCWGIGDSGNMKMKKFFATAERGSSSCTPVRSNITIDVAPANRENERRASPSLPLMDFNLFRLKYCDGCCKNTPRPFPTGSQQTY
ncbi:hypothetical protein Trydic_g16665 [Trypoxylus dichotomus]